MDKLHPLATIITYHAHIYFDEATAQQAQQLREAIADRFSVQMGRWHDKLVGPHSKPMYQVAFEKSLFDSFVPWLVLNRGVLTVLIHPNTRQPRRDHEVHGFWLGQALVLNTDRLPEHSDEAVTPFIVANTHPTLHDL